MLLSIFPQVKVFFIIPDIAGRVKKGRNHRPVICAISWLGMINFNISVHLPRDT